MADELVSVARARQRPTAFIEEVRLFGDIAADQRFVQPYLAALRSLIAAGAHATVSRYGEL
jgi:mannitol 2-dehydrogenase